MDKLTKDILNNRLPQNVNSETNGRIPTSKELELTLQVVELQKKVESLQEEIQTLKLQKSVIRNLFGWETTTPLIERLERAMKTFLLGGGVITVLITLYTFFTGSIYFNTFYKSLLKLLNVKVFHEQYGQWAAKDAVARHEFDRNEQLIKMIDEGKLNLKDLKSRLLEEQEVLKGTINQLVAEKSSFEGESITKEKPSLEDLE